MRISATQLESFRLFMTPDQEWMSEDDLAASIRGTFVPNHKVNLGQAFGRILEQPERYWDSVESYDPLNHFSIPTSGYRIEVNGETFEFGADVVEPCLALIDHDRGVFEAKAVKRYGLHDVASKADYLIGAELHEFKTTLSSFDFDKYAQSCQWRYMADAMRPALVRYHVFCLSEGTNGVIELRGIESFNLYPYPALHEDCSRLVDKFVEYVTAKGLTDVLEARQRDAA